LGRIMALDVGSKTIGVAVSDPLGWTGQGVGVIRRKNREHDLAEVLRLVREWDVTELVVGLPLSLDGSRGPQAQQAEAFARRLAETTGLPVRMQDERLTTRQAERVLVGADLSRRRRRQVIDKAAAVLILQSYLDARRAREAARGTDAGAAGYDRWRVARCPERSVEEGDQQRGHEDGREQVGHADALEFQEPQADGEDQQPAGGGHLRHHGRGEDGLGPGGRQGDASLVDQDDQGGEGHPHTQG